MAVANYGVRPAVPTLTSKRSDAGSGVSRTGLWPRPCALLPCTELLLCVQVLLQQQDPPEHCVGQDVLQADAADDAGYWQALVSRWVERVELAVPVQQRACKLFNVRPTALTCNAASASFKFKLGLRECMADSPLSRQAVDQPVDAVARDTAFSEHLFGNIGIDGLQRAQSIALDLRMGRNSPDKGGRRSQPSGTPPDMPRACAAAPAAHLNGAAVLALAANSRQVALQNRDFAALLDQTHCQHQAADAGAGNEHMQRPLLVKARDGSCKRCRAAGRARSRGQGFRSHLAPACALLLLCMNAGGRCRGQCTCQRPSRRWPGHNRRMRT